MKCCVFESKAGADAYQAQALADWLAVHNEHPYVDQTTAWAESRQRVTDGKYYVTLCPVTDNTGQDVENYDPSWDPDPGPPEDPGL